MFIVVVYFERYFLKARLAVDLKLSLADPNYLTDEVEEDTFRTLE
jgi:hypothetical protein